MSVATLPFPPQSTTHRPFRRSLVLAARAAFHIVLLPGYIPLRDFPRLADVVVSIPRHLPPSIPHYPLNSFWIACSAPSTSNHLWVGTMTG